MNAERDSGFVTGLIVGVVVGGLLMALTGCAAMPDRARVELSHDSHSTVGSSNCHANCNEDDLSRVSLILKWQRGPVTIEAGEGWNLEGRNGGGFYGPSEVFTARMGYEFNLRRP